MDNLDYWGLKADSGNWGLTEADPDRYLPAAFGSGLDYQNKIVDEYDVAAGSGDGSYAASWSPWGNLTAGSDRENATTLLGAQQEPEAAKTPPGNDGNSQFGIATANAVGGIASALGGAFSAYFNTKTRKAVAGYQAQIAESQARIEETNARMAELSAHMALERSNWEIGRLSMRASQIKSKQRVAQAANGVRVGVGSAAVQTASTELMKEIDINQQYVNGYRAAWQLRTQGTQAKMRAIAARSHAATYRLGASAMSPIGSAVAVGAAGLLQAYRGYRKDMRED